MTQIGNDGPRIAGDTTASAVRDILSSADDLARLSDDELALGGEIAYRDGDVRTALKAAEALVARQPQVAGLHSRVGSLRAAIGDSPGAEAALLAALERDDTIESAYQLLVHLRGARGDIAGAIAAIRAQEARCGGSAGLWLQLVSLLTTQGDTDGALEAVRRINDAGAPTEGSLLLEAELAYQLGRFHAAIAAAERASRLFPGSGAALAVAGRILCGQGLFQQAAEALERATRLAPEDHALAHLLAAALTQTGAYRAALTAALAALRLAPGEAEYCYTAAILCDLVGERARAVELMRRAIAVDPARVAYHVALAQLHGRRGAIDEAVDALAVAQRLEPDNKSLRHMSIYYLSGRVAGEFVADGSATIPRPMPRAPASMHEGAPGFGTRLRTQGRVLVALVLREFKHRTAQSRLGTLWLFMPQAIQVVMLGVVLSIFNDGRPPIGDQLFFFYATGVLPFYLFIHVVDHSQNIFLDNAAVLQVPVITRLDLAVATSLVELLIGLTIAVVTFGVFALADYGPRSDNQIEAVFAMLVAWMFGFGIGLISAVMNNLYRFWSEGWLLLQRMLYIASGVFFIPQNMPGWIREALIWNPVLQCIEWFRIGLYQQYQPPWLDKPYVLAVAFGSVVTGLVLERALRRRMRAL